jgi:hypothetical protein
MNGEPVQDSVYDEYLKTHPCDELAVVRLGSAALSYVPLVEPVFLVPDVYIRDMQVNSTMSWEMMGSVTDLVIGHSRSFRW